MSSGRSWTNVCAECGRHVEILNGDFEFSMELHKQSHKSLDYVNNAIGRNLDHSTEKIVNAPKLNLNYCYDSRESLIDNDLNLSFNLHSQSQKSTKENLDTLSDHSSTSSGKGQKFHNKTKEKEETPPVLTSMLDAVFHTLPIGLKAHRGFVSEQSCNKAICNLCEVIIEPIFRVSEHLKTKLHEDNTIQVIKTILCSELNDQMEFISFYGSNLCCNLCRCKIDLCSENLHKTVVDIFAHNAGKGHLSKKTVNQEGNQSNEALVILKRLSLINPIVNENQHFIEYKMYPYFKCKQCDEQIAYSENQNEMVNKFSDHFNAPGHIKSTSATSLLTKWDSLTIAGKENHKFVIFNQNIHCVSCNCVVETNLDQLLVHVRRNSALSIQGQSELASGVQAVNPPYALAGGSLSFKGVNMRSNEEERSNKPSISRQSQAQELSAKMKRLVHSLPLRFRNIIVENKKGEAVCSVCKCVIPATTHNLTTHLNGSSHMKKQNEAKLSERVNYRQPPKTLGAQTKETPAQIDKGLSLLTSNNPQLVANKEYLVKYNSENTYICVLCTTIIQTDVNSLQRNILSHIQSQDHAYKSQLKEEMSKLLPLHRYALVRELFNLIPMTFQRDMKFIKAPEGVNFVFCEICYIKIPRHKNCLLEHLEGVFHETAVERLGKIPNKMVLGVKSDDCDGLFKELLKSNKEIKISSKYLGKINDDYFCKLCKATIRNVYDINLLEGNFMSHITGKKHKKNVEDEFNDNLDKIQLTSTIVKDNRRFLKKGKDKVFCTLCTCQMPLAESTDALKYNLEVHLSGSSHCTRKIESEANPSLSSIPETLPPNFAQEMNSLFHQVFGVEWIPPFK